MKRLFITTAFVFIFSFCTVLAQNEKYTQAMTTSIEAMNALDKAKPDAKALQEVANRFERIAAAEPKEWLPRYYAAHCYVLMGYIGNTLTEKDQFLDKADVLLKESETIAGKATDEILVMEAYETQIRLAADPINRWQNEGEKFGQLIEKAKSLNPENPRIYYLEGSSVFFTPEDYGGGKKAAKPILEKASGKFSNFKPESSIHPDWGKLETEWMLSQSNQ